MTDMVTTIHIAGIDTKNAVARLGASTIAPAAPAIVAVAVIGSALKKFLKAAKIFLMNLNIINSLS
jgi:hypothetical protein